MANNTISLNPVAVPIAHHNSIQMAYEQFRTFFFLFFHPCDQGNPEINRGGGGNKNVKK